MSLWSLECAVDSAQRVSEYGKIVLQVQQTSGSAMYFFNGPMNLCFLQGQVVMAEIQGKPLLLGHCVHVASRVRSSQCARKDQTKAECFMVVLNHKDRGAIISNGLMILWHLQLAL